MKIKIVLKTENLYRKIENATESFIEMESKSLHNVDIEDCIADYISALLIFDQTLIELK
ncbi:neck protein [Acinetobacter phage Brutus]|nr:neck protein [Acinetobacter phage Brutus]